MTLEQQLHRALMQRYEMTRDNAVGDVDRARLDELDLAIHAIQWRLNHEADRQIVDAP